MRLSKAGATHQFEPFIMLMKQALATAEETREIYRRWRAPAPFRCLGHLRKYEDTLHPTNSKKDPHPN